jgi:hypothetical protein
MSKTESKVQKPVPVVTERTRKPREGFKNYNPGIEVAPGLNLQDVPRHMIQNHLRGKEQIAKQRFKDQYGGSFGGSESF